MPLPDHLDPHLILEHLSPLKDVDGITPTNAGRLHLGLPSLRPSTPAGGLELLDFHRVDLPGASVVVIGRSNVVGRPLATLLTQRNATVTLCHRQTRDLAGEVRRAEVVCIAAGSPGLVTADMVDSRCDRAGLRRQCRLRATGSWAMPIIDGLLGSRERSRRCRAEPGR